ncbi:MAG: cob(I)yrinic acid a,c-diamide adenosyltransferase [Candidatus Phosphoribacter sp.]
MVNLTRIYTRTGDDGTTALGDFSRTAKTDARLAAYADANEANAAVGVAVVALTTQAVRNDVVATLRRVQNELFDVGADLCVPLHAVYDYPPLRVQQPWIDDLEADCDRYLAELEPLRSFILPGGTAGAAYLHVATTIVRRAERSTWAAIEHYGTADGVERGEGGVNPLAATYLNRLSDLLFVLARVANLPTGDVLWQPGGGRVQPSKPARGTGTGSSSAEVRGRLS